MFRAFPEKQSRKNRLPISLNHNLDCKLLSYVAAASASAVGVMALAQPSQAEIIYTATNQTLKAGGSLAIDFNNDGTADVTIENVLRNEDVRGGVFPTGGFSQNFEYLRVTAAGNNRIVVSAASYYASALQSGRNIGKKLGAGVKWVGGGGHSMENCSSGSGAIFRVEGPWRDVNTRYLGVVFSIDGEAHFGWARFTVTHPKDSCFTTAVLTGYAYESVAGEAIKAGQTSGSSSASAEQSPAATLGSLALGSGGIGAWRREDAASASKN
jgi:hypothetical protein